MDLPLSTPCELVHLSRIYFCAANETNLRLSVSGGIYIWSVEATAWVKMAYLGRRLAREALPAHSGLIPAAFMIGRRRLSSLSRNALISAGEVGQG
jgi:hypothetical protein